MDGAFGFVWCSACRAYHAPQYEACEKNKPGGWARALMAGRRS